MSDWKKRGVWTVVGAALGFGACSLLQTQPVSAVATSGGVEGTLIATGQSQNNALELLWMLDDRGMLSCFMMAGNRVNAAPPIDVKQIIKGKGGKRGKYAMVTGRYAIDGNISDVLYVTESASNTVTVFAFTRDGVIRPLNTLTAGTR